MHMKAILIVTHAQSMHHLENKVGGWYDSNLSELGHKQSRLIAEKLKDSFSLLQPKIFSSDLKRAYQTAEPISEAFAVPIERLPGLREMSYGEAEGKEQEWLDERFVPPPVKGDRMNHAVCPGAETRKFFVERIYQTMESIYAATNTCSIVVSHGFAHTFIVSWWIGLPQSKTDYVHFKAQAGGITHLLEDDIYGNRSVEQLSSIDHLK